MSLTNAAFVYDTAALIEVVPNLKKAQKFLLDKFFPFEVVSDTEYVAIDIDVGKRRMSPFVSPMVEGKLVEQRRIQTNLFKPPYIKDKRAPDLRKPIRRMIGERIGGAMSGAEREAANIAFEMADQLDMIDRRLEWMASQVMQLGTLTVTGDGFPTTLLDFGRDAALTVTLTGGNRWGQSANYLADGHDPIPTQNIETWQALILKKSGGVATDIVFTQTPWQKFLNAEFAQGAIQYPRLQNQNEIRPGAEIQRGGIFKGNWGQYRLWLYNDWYVDDNDVEQPMIPDGTVLMCGDDMMGTRAFAVILDPAFNYASLPYAPKTWLKEDPAQRIIMMQSSPLVIPSRVNACFAATVI